MDTAKKLNILKQSDLYLFHLDRFEWNDDNANDELNLWYRTKNKNFSLFFDIFAQDGTGGLFALWYQNGKSDQQKETLVAYFDSEGQLGVAASDFDEFLSIMATGLNLFDFVFYGKKTFFNDFIQDPEEKADKEKDHKILTDFLKDRFIILPAADIDRIREAAETQLPVLKLWLDQFIA